MIKINNLFKKIDKKVLLIILIGFIILSPLLSGKYMKGHDTFYHYSNIKAITDTIDFSKFKFLPSKIVPLIAEDMGWGNGIFYPSFPHYISSFIYKFFSVFDIKILTIMNVVHILVLILSGIFMYLFVNKISNNSYSALLSSMIYMTFPYFFMDIGVRDAYQETFLFLSLPLIFLGIDYLFSKEYKKFYIYFIIGYFITINSHLVMSIYLSIFVLIYLILNIKKVLKKEILVRLIIASLLTLGLSLPFILPLIEHTVLGNYVVYKKNMMWTVEKVLGSRVSILDYFRNPTKIGYVSLRISFTGLIGFILVVFNKENIKEYERVFKYVLVAIFAFIIMLPIIPWNIFPSFLLNIQMVWRIQLFLVFFISVVAGFSTTLFKGAEKNYCIIVILLSIINLFSFYDITYLDYYDEEKININKNGAASYQYLTVNGYNNLDKLEILASKISILKGDASIKNVKSNTPNLSFYIITKGSEIEIPRIYYLGYDISLNNKKIKYKESSNGLIKLKINESGIVKVKYSGTLGYKIGMIISVISLILFVLCIKFCNQVKIKKILG